MKMLDGRKLKIQTQFTFAKYSSSPNPLQNLTNINVWNEHENTLLNFTQPKISGELRINDS